MLPRAFMCENQSADAALFVLVRVFLPDVIGDGIAALLRGTDGFELLLHGMIQLLLGRWGLLAVWRGFFSILFCALGGCFVRRARLFAQIIDRVGGLAEAVAQDGFGLFQRVAISSRALPRFS